METKDNRMIYFKVLKYNVHLAEASFNNKGEVLSDFCLGC